MKRVSMNEAQTNIDALLTSAQAERIVVLRAGKPSAVLIGVEGYDAEDLRLANSPGFWQMIEDRRKGRSIPLAELRGRLKLPAAKRKGTKNGQARRKENARPRRPHR